ncbi:MAG: Transglutaminase-like superfamily protein [Methanocella sp. PtaU1.Bin125]|nr:MAG: Transglutaminase-like superfamily protein [Methanocella sp. PtaU1.Bin125]
MGGYFRVLFFAVLLLAIAVSGCSLPAGGPGVLTPVSPTPTPMPSPSPTPVPAPSVTPAPVAAAPPTGAVTGGDYSRTYSWEYKNVDWSFTAVVQKAMYDLFKAKPHSTGVSFASYAMAAEDRDSLRDAVSQFRQGGAGYGYNRYDDAMNIITFVQSVPYVDDHPAGSPKYPLETLADGQGDCKDKAVLAAALLREAGFDVVLLRLPEHLAVGLNVDAAGTSYEYGGARYYYVETTGKNWEIGEVPDALKTAGATVLPLQKNPSLEITVTATPLSNASGVVEYRAGYTVRNIGPGTAKNVVLTVHALALLQGENVVWRPEQVISLGDIAEGQTIRSDALLMMPAGEPTRVVCIATGDNVDRTEARTGDFVAGM